MFPFVDFIVFPNKITQLFCAHDTLSEFLFHRFGKRELNESFRACYAGINLSQHPVGCNAVIRVNEYGEVIEP